jgi:hypothetical protein
VNAAMRGTGNGLKWERHQSGLCGPWTVITALDSMSDVRTKGVAWNR